MNVFFVVDVYYFSNVYEKIKEIHMLKIYKEPISRYISIVKTFILYIFQIRQAVVLVYELFC